MTDTPEQGQRKRKETAAPETAAKTVFLVSPIGKANTPEHRRAKLVLDFIVRKAFAAPEWLVIRADNEDSPDSISTQVIKRIVESDLIVADLSGHNPNVFYELAVAHGYERPVLHMITDGERMPFDVADQRAISYELENPESVDAAITALRNSAKWVAENPGALRTPLSTYGAFTAISNSSPGEGSNEAIAEALSQIVTRLGRLERGQRAAVVDAGWPGRQPMRTPKAKAAAVMDELVRLDRFIAELREAEAEGDLRAAARIDEVMAERDRLLALVAPDR